MDGSSNDEDVIQNSLLTFHKANLPSSIFEDFCLFNQNDIQIKHGLVQQLCGYVCMCLCIRLD